MDQNNNKKRPNRNRGGKRGNLRGLISLISWALILTVIISYAGNYISNSGRAASSVELEYGGYQDMVESGQVERVDFSTDENILIITPVDGYTYTDEEGVTYLKSTDAEDAAVYTFTNAAGSEETTKLRFFTVQIESNDATIAFLNEWDNGGLRINEDYVPPMSPLLLFFISRRPALMDELKRRLFV